MAGLQELAAIIALAETGLRSICMLYNFIRDIKYAPKEIQRLLNETFTLQKCLTQLNSFDHIDAKTCAIIESFGLPQALRTCGESCAELYNALKKWSLPGTLRLSGRVHFRIHKKAIAEAIATISSTRETTILTISAAQLAITLKMAEPPRTEVSLAEKDPEAPTNIPAEPSTSHYQESTLVRVQSTKELVCVRRIRSAENGPEPQDDASAVNQGEFTHGKGSKQNWNGVKVTGRNISKLGITGSSKSGITGSSKNIQKWTEVDLKAQRDAENIGINGEGSEEQTWSKVEADAEEDLKEIGINRESD